MTLLALRYQRSRPGHDGNSAEMLDAHFRHIATHYENVVPGQRLLATRDSVCLIFDGAFHDFHRTTLPLLRKHDLRAVVAVTPSLIRDRAERSSADRISTTSAEAYAHPSLEAFCTWTELSDLVASGHVEVAAHGYTHRALDTADADLEAEVHVPRTLLGARLRTTVESFVFPHGRYCRSALNETRSGYDFVFGYGDAINHSWRHPVLYRINANNLRDPAAPFHPARLLCRRVRRWWNRARRA